MVMRWLPWFFGLLGVACLGVAIYGWVQDWNAGPALALETTDLDVGRIAVGAEPEVAVALHNRGGRDLRVVGEQYA